jgi:hypothetical protein
MLDEVLHFLPPYPVNKFLTVSRQGRGRQKGTQPRELVEELCIMGRVAATLIFLSCFTVTQPVYHSTALMFYCST